MSFHCFENPIVLHAIQSRSSDRNVALSFYWFENPTVLHAIQSLILFLASIYAIGLDIKHETFN